MPKLGDFLSSINSTKKSLFDGEDNPASIEKDYVPFVINRCLSYFPDTVLYANEMNRLPGIPGKMQYDYLLNSIRSRKRFSKWDKPEENPDIELVQKYYSYSRKKAEDALKILTADQVEFIRQKLFTGGKS